MSNITLNTGRKLGYQMERSYNAVISIKDDKVFDKLVLLNAKSYGMIYETKKNKRIRNRLFRKLIKLGLV